MEIIKEKFGEQALPLFTGVFITDPSQPGELFLRGAKCSKCECFYFPYRRVCPNCFDRAPKTEIAMGQKAKLAVCTKVDIAPPGFQAPYILGYVDLDEGPRIFTQIDFPPEESVKLVPGTPMQLQVQVVAKDDFGNPIVGWKYHPLGWGEKA
jgi:uncharacterized OB-fold protein